MWTYTAYILNGLGKLNGYGNLDEKTLSKFVFDDLWRKNKLTFHDGEEDLMDDLRYLERLKVIGLNGKTITLNKGKLVKISDIVENSGLLTGVKMFDEYKRRIDCAFDNYNNSKESM
jgi:hypothetical protein